MPKDELLDAIWPDVTVTEASLSQAVRDIRKALRDEAGQIPRTVVGRGFMLRTSDRTATSHADKPAERSSAWARPRIALLPLADRTGAPGQGPIIEALVEEITASLACFGNMTVVARHSAFAAASDRSGDLAEIGRHLRADYLVDGSARLQDDRLVLAVALSDVGSGEVLWGDSFACEGTGWLTLQDVIPRRIVSRLFTSVEEAGLRSSLRRPATKLSAFEHLARGRALFRSFKPGVNERARDHFLMAIMADPALGLAHSLLGLTEIALHDYALAPLDVKRQAKARGSLAVELSPDESRCHSHLSYFHGYLREFAAAEKTAQRAVDLNPCDAEAIFALANASMRRGQAEECLDWIERAKEINPLWPAYYDATLSSALFDLGRYDEAAQVLLRLPRLSARQEMRLAATFALMGERDLARKHATRLACSRRASTLCRLPRSVRCPSVRAISSV
jgi:TolB-like protein